MDHRRPTPRSITNIYPATHQSIQPHRPSIHTHNKTNEPHERSIQSPDETVHSHNETIHTHNETINRIYPDRQDGSWFDTRPIDPDMQIGIGQTSIEVDPTPDQSILPYINLSSHTTSIHIKDDTIHTKDDNHPHQRR